MKVRKDGNVMVIVLLYSYWFRFIFNKIESVVIILATQITLVLKKKKRTNKYFLSYFYHKDVHLVDRNVHSVELGYTLDLRRAIPEALIL